MRPVILFRGGIEHEEELRAASRYFKVIQKQAD
jgi:hypothetical protein